MKKNILMIISTLICGVIFTNCGSDKEEPKGNIQYLKTELGGCNRESESVLRSADSESSETKDDVVTITFSKDFVNVFVGLNYICCAPFETKCETIDDVIVMYITDTCINLYEDCYCRCMCYYTFDFMFNYQGTINQKYKVVLIDPRKENQVVISEGWITDKK